SKDKPAGESQGSGGGREMTDNEAEIARVSIVLHAESELAQSRIQFFCQDTGKQCIHAVAAWHLNEQINTDWIRLILMYSVVSVKAKPYGCSRMHPKSFIDPDRHAIMPGSRAQSGHRCGGLGRP
ncbi:hypothetical protein Tco_1207193, partial [Tanacetum coccineum]